LNVFLRACRRDLIEKPKMSGRKRCPSAGYALFGAGAQILKNFLLALLDFEQDWCGEPEMILT
jgi:hypothetical protein